MRIGPFELKLPSLVKAAEDALHFVESAPAAAVDGFERLANRVETDGVALLTGGGDRALDGMLLGADGVPRPASTPLEQLPAVLPAGGVRNDQVVIEINGVGCNLARQSNDLRAVADATGSRVVGLHNATDGLPEDALQELGDEARAGPDPAARALAGVVERELAAGRPVHLVAHSQGAAITARALDAVKAELTSKLGSGAAAEQALASVTVETYGGAAWAYPDGPHYTHYVNLADIVPQSFGLGVAEDLGFAQPGRGARIVTFTHALGFHSLEMYLQHRLPDPPQPR